MGVDGMNSADIFDEYFDDDEKPKYIIRNCPAYEHGFCTSKTIYVAGCSQYTDCKLKQIAELCKKAPILDADWILKLLDIQEIE